MIRKLLRGLAVALVLGASAHAQSVSTPVAPVSPISTPGAASAPALLVNGPVYSAGSGSTNWPLSLVQPNGTTSAIWNTAGTMMGVNAATGFTGLLADFQVGGAEVFKIDPIGNGTATVRNMNTTFVQLGATATYLYSPNIATIQLGQNDSSAPVAQTLQPQGANAGSNKNGPDFTINAATSTGSGVGGKFIFQTGLTGTTGSTQNGRQRVFSLDTNQHALFSSAAIPVVSSCGTGSPTVTAGSTDTAGEVTIGTTATACTITFKIAYASAPFCTATDITTAVNLLSVTKSASALVFNMTVNSGDVIDWHCFGA